MTKTSELERQREQRRRELTYMRDWIHSHPHRVDPEVRPAAIDFLNNSIAELDEPSKMKNTRRAGRMSLRDRLRTLVAVIVAQNLTAGK
ncbi:hypothetical protein J19TS2_31270 [Cohnella xylanilytica]|uniref:hypothetical protein n=1 Tax=Cohnella xylanilytica TaxID=557555 RepID=UPI001B17AD0A|nr:hypothetical protein [Cohnella xylanilytica]GIO13572.1 hypothetical protein J19TS2_31270 [Cohnella xylanilytica]